MPRPGKTQQLLYKNSDGNNTVLGFLGDTLPSGTFQIQKARYKPRNRGIDKLSIIGEKRFFKNIPQEDSDFATDEPSIFWQEYRQNKKIQNVDTSNNNFTVNGDLRDDFEEAGAVKVVSQNRSDDGKIYKLADSDDLNYDSSNDASIINVDESISDGTIDGQLQIWGNVFRGFATSQGKITEQGNVKFKLEGFINYIGQENVTVSSGDVSNIEDAASELTPSDYTLDTPDSSSVSYIDKDGNTQPGYAPLDNYSLNNVDRNVGFRELVRDYGYALKLKADKTIRFEPVGFGSSIDTIDSPAEGDTDNTTGVFKEWTAGDVELTNNINTVRVVNSNDSSTADSGIITNSTSVQQIGRQTPKGGNPKKIGYVDSDDEAKRVAQNLIQDRQNKTEGGRVKVGGRFTNNVSNSSFTLNDPVRSIDSEVYVAWSQVNFYPEDKTILEFQIENQSEKESNITDDVRGERSTVFSSQEKNVGEQNADLDTGSAPSDTQRDPDTGLDDDNQGEAKATATYIPKKKTDSGQADGLTNSNGNITINVEFSTNFNQTPNVQVTPEKEYVDKFRITSLDSNGFTIGALSNLSEDTQLKFRWRAEANPNIDEITASADVPSAPNTSNQPDDTSAVFDGVFIDISINNYAGETANVDYTVTNTTESEQILSGSESVSNEQSNNITESFSTEDVSEGDTLEVELEETDTGKDFISGDAQLSSSSVVFHINTLTTHTVGEDIDTEDFNHGGGDKEKNNHGASGSTDPKSIDTSQEEDISR